MATLFELTNEFRSLYELATEDGDPQALADTIESMLPELQQKAVGYVAVINQLEMESAKADEISKAFKAKADARKNSVKALKNALLMALDSINATEMQAGDWTIKAVKNGGVQPMVIDGEVPESFLKVIYEADKDKIRQALKDGQELSFARLEERGRHITIK